MSKVALITRGTGQDGAYLAEFRLKQGYVVHGIKRRASSFNTDRIDLLYQAPHVEHRNFILHYGDLTDSTSLIRIIQDVSKTHGLGWKRKIRLKEGLEKAYQWFEANQQDFSAA